MKIEYFLPVDCNSDELEGFKAIHNNDNLKEFYKKKEHETLETKIYNWSRSIIPFLKDSEVLNTLQREDLKCLPIVKINGSIFITQRVLSLNELSDILDIGISIQKD